MPLYLGDESSYNNTQPSVHRHFQSLDMGKGGGADLQKHDIRVVLQHFKKKGIGPWEGLQNISGMGLLTGVRGEGLLSL